VSYVLFVSKANGKKQMCIDYRELNTCTIAERYCLPLIKEVTGQLMGSKVFTKLDITSAFNQMRIKDSAIEKTAVATEFGNFKFVVMPFGLKNTPATFQRLINKIQKEFIGHGVKVYMVDVLVYSKGKEENVTIIKTVLKKISKLTNVRESKEAKIFP
jgi:Reverse transcriptase (RNA-dependent DNA polymerase)